MLISREKHWQFLEDELKAETEEFKAKFEAPAKQLLDEKGEMFVALFESFHGNGSMVMKFPKTRGLPRKGAHFMCMLLPKEFRAHTSWGSKTYKDLYAARYKGTDCVCIYHGKSEDERFSIVGFRGVDVEFQKTIEDNPGVILVFAPQFPPLEYPSNLQKVVLDVASPSLAEVLDAEYKPRAWAPRLIKEDAAADVVLSQMALTKTTILQGPPGTGKTFLIAQICAELCAAGKSVLVTALTNRALIEVSAKPALSDLISKGRVYKVNLTVDEAKEVKGLKLARDIIPIHGELVLATFYKSSGCAADTQNDGLFDYVIVDEASQAYTVMLAAASKIGKKCLWVGDINQLSPVVVLNADRVKERGYDDMIDGLRFISCNREYPVLQLTKTYRLGKRATSFTGIFYGDTLLSIGETKNDLSCLKNIVHPQGGPALFWVDMPVGDNAPQSAIAQATILVKSIVAEAPQKEVAVLAHRIPTVVALQRSIAHEIGNKGNVLVETVAKIQGLTTDITIFVVPNTRYRYGLERRLFNVATSRAKEHTIIIADKSVFEHKELDQDVMCYLRRLAGERVEQKTTKIDVGSDMEKDVLDDAVNGGSCSSGSGNSARESEPTFVPSDLAQLQAAIIPLQVKLMEWIKCWLPIIYPTNTWRDGVIRKLSTLQYNAIKAKRIMSVDGLDLNELLSVFIGSFREFQAASHIADVMQTLAFHIRDIRHENAHRRTNEILNVDAKDIKYHIDTIDRFLAGLDKAVKPESIKPKIIVTGSGDKITVK